MGEVDARRGVGAGEKQPRNVAFFCSVLCLFLKSGARTADTPPMFSVAPRLLLPQGLGATNPTTQAEHQKQPVDCNTATCTPIGEGNYVSGGKPRRGSRGKATGGMQV